MWENKIITYMHRPMCTFWEHVQNEHSISSPWTVGKAVGLLFTLQASGYPSLISFCFWKWLFALFHLFLGGGELGLRYAHGAIGMLASLGWLLALKALGSAQVRLFTNSQSGPFLFPNQERNLHVLWSLRALGQNCWSGGERRDYLAYPY